MLQKTLFFSIFIPLLLVSIRRLSPEIDIFVYIAGGIGAIISALGLWDLRQLKFKIRVK